MKGTKQWAKSTNGPDEIDCVTMMRAISGVHSGHVALIVSPHGIGYNGGVDIAASVIFDLLPGSSLPSTVAAHCTWPNAENATFWGACYAVLFSLDQEIGKIYNQESLWE